MLGSHVLADGKVRFMYHDNSADRVAVAGNFSDWKPVPLAPQGEGWWGEDLGPLPNGDVFYKFVTRTGWHLDQFNYRRAHEGENSYLDVGGHCGHLLRRGFHSSSLGKAKNYCVYLPPAYAPSTWRSFPVLYLMGGLFEDELGWVSRAGVEDLLDQLIGNGSIDDVVVVMPDKDDTVFHAEAWGGYLDYLAEDLRNHVEGEYRTLPVRGIEGLSLGGGWAARLGLMYPERYCSVSSLSGHFGDDSYHLVRMNLERLLECKTRFRFACGDGEGDVIENNGAFSRFMERLGISSEFHVNHGPHEWPLWRQQIGHSLQFHNHSFRGRY